MPKPAFPILFSLCVTILLAGCTRFSVEQSDSSLNERTITTKIKGTAWFSSAQNIAKLKAIQTDKTQSFGSEAFAQHGTTNMTQALGHIAEILRLLRPPGL